MHSNSAKRTAGRSPHCNVRWLHVRRSACMLAVALATSVLSCKRDTQYRLVPSDNAACCQELCVQRLILVDETGKGRGILESTVEDGTTLAFLGSDGSLGIKLHVSSSKASIGLGHVAGQPMAEIGVGSTTGEPVPVLVLRDSKGRKRLATVVTGSGTSGVMLFDDAGVSQCHLHLAQDGGVALVLGGEPNNPGVVLGIDSEGDCELRLHDRERARAGMAVVDGVATVAVCGSDGERVWGRSER